MPEKIAHYRKLLAMKIAVRNKVLNNMKHQGLISLIHQMSGAIIDLRKAVARKSDEIEKLREQLREKES
ncbi:hypothetical protein [Terribacillus saccharophilus]|uniref:hypothetical protein n=1 Tax=Terribacillus saccharophilus TaxID=361277 RepID=UPI000C99DCF2|nr:hypothetical protein [Terribacillus goriensis]